MTILSTVLTLLPFVLSPGASFALTVSGAAAGDRTAGLRVGLGTALGIALIATVAGISGIGTVVASNSLIRGWFEIVGGLLLLIFGAVPLRRLWNARNRGEPEQPRTRPVHLIAWGFVAVITNVKALTLYVLVVPPTIPTGASALGGYAIIAIVHIAMLLIWLGLITALITRAPAITNRGLVMVGLQLMASGVLIALGIQSIINGLAVMT
ncbi:LysE family translocator [Glaciihabitans sp. dw_435]|uniref:LysE family translocator n=1 Tax=Glaciihabitans sp. dw_435 TaxID=2720081 RepID=UPI001BD48E98|nr:LysE family transporter [Glaciihabitans sp. dw_435]